MYKNKIALSKKGFFFNAKKCHDCFGLGLDNTGFQLQIPVEYGRAISVQTQTLKYHFGVLTSPVAAASPGKGLSLQNANRSADKLQSYDVSTKG